MNWIKNLWNKWFGKKQIPTEEIPVVEESKFDEFGHVIVKKED